MKSLLLCLAALVGTLVVIESTELPDACRPKIPDCPNMSATSACSTCCCNSTTNVEFFNSSAEEKSECTASPAIYQVTFTYTWSQECHPDFTPGENAGWSQPISFSHNGNFKMWDACMDHVSEGVKLFSTTGDHDGIIGEGVVAALGPMTILDAPIFDAREVEGGEGSTSIHLTVDKNHQLVSTLTRMNYSSPGLVVGVADLVLCDGDKWKERVKICFELFSTASASDRVMERNSLQGNNCNFGYIDFDLVKNETFQSRAAIPETCYPQVPDECPKNNDQNKTCPTCCCTSSNNVEFYNASQPEPECTAEPAVYNMTFTGTWSEACHPGNFASYSIFQPVWSFPVGVSHNTKYKLWDACMDDVSVGVGLLSQIGLTSVLLQEFAATGSDILNFTVGPNLVSPAGEMSQKLPVDKDHQWVSAISNRGPTPDQIVGVAGLRLCDGDKWKKSVKVCFELFSTASASDRVAPEMKRNSVQGDSCSFGYIEFTLIESEKMEAPTKSEKTEAPTKSEKTEAPTKSEKTEAPTKSGGALLAGSAAVIVLMAMVQQAI